MTPEYEELIRIITGRRSVRRLKSDPVPPEAIEKILEAGRWAMSGANGQPWEFIVVTDPEMIKQLSRAYSEELAEYNFWMEQMRAPEFRHPAFALPGDPDEQLKTRKAGHNWGDAPVLIVVLGDGRKQWATVMGGHTMGRHQSHLTDGMANACTLMHLAAHALGLGSQWVTIQIEDKFKKILDVPEVITLHSIIPVGYPYSAPKAGVRQPLESMVHRERYDRGKYLSDKQIVEYIRDLRKRTIPIYQHGKKEGK